MTKLFMFMVVMIATSPAFARSELLAFECEKNVKLQLDRSNRQAIVNDEVLKPNRTQKWTIGQDSRGNRYELGYTEKTGLRALGIFEPLLNRRIATLYCRESRGT